MKVFSPNLFCTYVDCIATNHNDTAKIKVGETSWGYMVEAFSQKTWLPERRRPRYGVG